MAYVRKGKRRMRMRPRRKMPLKMVAKKKVENTRKMNINKGIHYFSRYVVAVDTNTLSTITSSIGAVLLARLTDIPNAVEFSSLFEQYRIIGVQYTFRLMDNPDSSSYLNQPLLPQGANFYPKLWYIIDRDDSTSPTLLTIRERGEARCKVLSPQRFIKVFVKYPKPLAEVIGNTGTAAAQMTNPVWLNTLVGTNPSDVPHYGLKVVLDKMGYAGNTFSVGIDKRYFFAFKGVK